MSMVVQHNLSAMNANRNLGVTTGSLSKSTEKLSSGYKINRAGDNAAGLAISEKMRGQIRGLNQASTNSEDGISMIQTAEGALNETHSILQRMRELAVQATNDTNTDDDRTQIQNEIDQLTQEVDRIATTTEFNTRKLLDGSRAGSVTEKAGKANVDSTFGNGMVSAAITKDGTAKQDFTDVIRIEVTKDFTEEQSTKGEQKLSDKAIDDIYSVLTGGTITSEEFKAEMLSAGSTVNTQTATKTAVNSLNEAIKTALSAEKAELTAAKTAANTAEGAVSLNEDLMATHFEGLKNYDDAVKNANESTAADKTGILASGVTVDDVEKAFNEYVDLLVEDGNLAAGTVGQRTSGATADAITEAENKLKSLFYAGNDTAKAATATTAGDFFNFSDLATADKTTGKVTDKDTVIANTSTNISTYATNTVNSLINAAKQVAGTKVEAEKYAADVEKQQKLVDTLSDTELTTAIYNYKKADGELTTLKANTNATADAKKAKTEEVNALKAEVDKLNTASSALTVTDLFGSTDDTKKFEIDSKVAKDGTLNVTLKNTEGDDTVITITNADKLKAGDVVTITSEKYVESKEAATGKEAFRLQVGANAGQEVALGINSMRAKDLEIVQTKEGSEGKALSVTNQASASLAVSAYDMAIQKVSTERAKMGAVQNRLEHTISNLDTSAENLQSAESRIRDTDMAEEMTNYSKSNILMQAGQSMLAQANQSAQGVLSLLQ